MFSLIEENYVGRLTLLERQLAAAELQNAELLAALRSANQVAALRNADHDAVKTLAKSGLAKVVEAQRLVCVSGAGVDLLAILGEVEMEFRGILAKV